MTKIKKLSRKLSRALKLLSLFGFFDNGLWGHEECSSSKEKSQKVKNKLGDIAELHYRNQLFFNNLTISKSFNG
jgi:hypothetical protein